jgi:hypothetical protein
VPVDFRKLFDEIEGWVCPEVRVLEKDTGAEMNVRNCESIMAEDEMRGMGGGWAPPRGQGEPQSS